MKNKEKSLNNFLNKEKLKKYIQKTQYKNLPIEKYLSYDLQNKIFTRVIKIKKIEKKINELWLIDNDLIECNLCGRVWDGNAQCPCSLFI